MRMQKQIQNSSYLSSCCSMYWRMRNCFMRYSWLSGVSSLNNARRSSSSEAMMNISPSPVSSQSLLRWSLFTRESICRVVRERSPFSIRLYVFRFIPRASAIFCCVNPMVSRNCFNLSSIYYAPSDDCLSGSPCSRYLRKRICFKQYSLLSGVSSLNLLRRSSSSEVVMNISPSPVKSQSLLRWSLFTRESICRLVSSLRPFSIWQYVFSFIPRTEAISFCSYPMVLRKRRRRSSILFSSA